MPVGYRPIAWYTHCFRFVVFGCALDADQFYQYILHSSIGIGPTIHRPDSKVHGTNMGPTWVLSAPDGPHVCPMNRAIRVPMCGWSDHTCLGKCMINPKPLKNISETLNQFVMISTQCLDTKHELWHNETQLWQRPVLIDPHRAASM